jgi:Raf kinase inhibitor-like YbhB/YbcL family protein
VAIEVKSSAFEAGQPIPRKYSCEGEDVSPPLSWSGLPKGTTSLALIMDDPDAPPGTWVHWVLFDLRGDLLGLEEGGPKNESLENGAVQGRSWGVDEFERNRYSGPCPPPGKPHHYHFKLYALDRKLGLKPDATKFDVLKAMKGHVLGQGELIGTYQR